MAEHGRERLVYDRALSGRPLAEDPEAVAGEPEPHPEGEPHGLATLAGDERVLLKAPQRLVEEGLVSSRSTAAELPLRCMSRS